MTINPDPKAYAVLYVDDEQQAGKYFRKGLEKDFRILIAGNVPEAIAILEKEGDTIGVVITDQRMPGQTGVELLTMVRQRRPAIVRILITAYSDLDSAVGAINAGCVYKYITKPADFAVLHQALSEGMALYRQTIERDALAATLRELEEQRRATQAVEAQREQLQQQLLEASREAGRAEVATGILHNVGNVLNSVNVSAALVNKTLKQSKIANLCKALTLLEEHQSDLSAFLMGDERGQRLPGYLAKLAQVLIEEQTTLAAEMESLGQSLEHIGQVVRMQQSHAKRSMLRQPVHPAELFENALRVNLALLEKNKVLITREFANVPTAQLDKHSVLQILINLLSNAANAVAHRPDDDRRITLRLGVIEREGRPNIQFQVIDIGQGIPTENLTRIFTHGFTTRTDGHGFGLHSSANAAREMGGSLTAASEGADRGATFTLELPTDTQGAAAAHTEPSEKAAA